MERAATSRSKVVITPLEYLARTFSNYATPIETIKPHPVPPWWSPPFDIDIDVDKTAKANHDATCHEATTLGKVTAHRPTHTYAPP